MDNKQRNEIWGCPDRCTCPKDLEICPNCFVHVVRGYTGKYHAELDKKLLEALINYGQ